MKVKIEINCKTGTDALMHMKQAVRSLTKRLAEESEGPEPKLPLIIVENFRDGDHTIEIKATTPKDLLA